MPFTSYHINRVNYYVRYYNNVARVGVVCYILYIMYASLHYFLLCNWMRRKMMRPCVMRIFQPINIQCNL